MYLYFNTRRDSHVNPYGCFRCPGCLLRIKCFRDIGRRSVLIFMVRSIDSNRIKNSHAFCGFRYCSADAFATATVDA